MKISLQGKRVIVTAGSAGMGRATAIAMHNLGATVFTCYVDHIRTVKFSRKLDKEGLL